MNIKAINILLIAMLALLSIGCKTRTQYDVIDRFLQNEFNKKDLADYDYILVINEMGDCIHCNKKFSESVSKYIDQDNTLFLICSLGASIDISAFIDQNKSNILYDFHNKFGDLNLIDYAAIIELKDNQVDTIIKIDLVSVNANISHLNTIFSTEF